MGAKTTVLWADKSLATSPVVMGTPSGRKLDRRRRVQVPRNNDTRLVTEDGTSLVLTIGVNPFALFSSRPGLAKTAAESNIRDQTYHLPHDIMLLSFMLLSFMNSHHDGNRNGNHGYDDGYNDDLAGGRETKSSGFHLDFETVLDAFD